MILYVVACAKTKHADARPIADLYRSPLFAKSRAYVEKTGDAWRVLSAEHGLIDPDRVVEPYDTTLSHYDKTGRGELAQRVAWQLADWLGELYHDARPPTWPPTERPVVVILAGRRYVELIEPTLAALGIPVVLPLAGKQIGERLSLLNAWLKRDPRDTGATK